MVGRQGSQHEERHGGGEPLPGPRPLAQPRLLRRLLREPVPVLDELHAAHGPICGLGAGPMRMAVVGGPELIAELHALPTASFRWGHKFNALGFVVGEGSMIVSDGDDHRRRRQAVTPGFARRRLNGWIPMIVERTDAAIDGLARRAEAAGGEPVDLYPVGRALVLDVVTRALFGERMAARAGEIGALFERPQAYLESPAVRQVPHPLPFTTRARVRADRRALDALVDAEIAHARAESEAGADPAPDDGPIDVLTTLVRSGALSDAEIRDQVVTLVGAGYDTTAASLAWMLWRATLAPGLWDRLGAEADAAFGEAPWDHRLLGRLDLADRVMREVLRLHPAGVLAPREAATDLVVGGHRIRRGTLILWSAHRAGRDPGAWADPLRFDPDRFRDLTDEQQAIADRAWVPFGGGARNCIGFALAQMELTLMIARLAQRLALTPVATTVPPPKGMVVNRPSGGVPLRVATRTPAPT